MSDKHTILYLITSTNVGGAEKALFELIQRLDKTAFRVHVCSIKKPGGFAARIESVADGFYCLGLGESGGIMAALNFFPALIRLIRLVRRVRPVILHSFLFRANILGRIAGALGKVPVRISSIRVIEHNEPFKHIIERLTAPLVHKYIAVSEAVRRFTIATSHVSPEKIVTIYNGIAGTGGRKTHSADTGPVAIDPRCSAIGLVGRFHAQKGHTVFVAALKIAVAREPRIKAYLFGEGPEEGAVRHMVSDEGLSDHVVFMKTVENITHYIARLDIIVLPSLWEGFPNVLLEAMSEARPVVVSALAGMDEIVADNETGILFQPGDAAALADAIVMLIRDKQRGRAMGAAGQLRARTMFSIENTVNQTVAVYKNLLAHNAGI